MVNNRDNVFNGKTVDWADWEETDQIQRENLHKWKSLHGRMLVLDAMETFEKGSKQDGFADSRT